MARTWLPALLLLTLSCRGGGPAEPDGSTSGDETPTIEVTEGPVEGTSPGLDSEEIVALSSQLEGEWRLLLTAEEEAQRREALAQVARLGDNNPHAREMRAALEESRDDGMTVTDSTIALHLMRREVALTWTLMQDVPGVLAIETVDDDGRRQIFDVTFDGPDRVTLAGRGGGSVSRFERARRSP